MKGYIGVAPYELISSPVLQLSQAKALNWIREMRDSRQMLAFRTKNGQEIVLVGISNLVIDTDPMIQNRIPFTMTVKEVPILSYNKQGNLAIPSGTANVASLSSPMGTATVQTISLATANVAQTITDLILSIPVKGDRQVKNIFPIQIPQSGNGTYNFNFNAKCNGQVFVFNFKYTNVWNIAVTMSSGAIRTATLIPNVTQWSAYSDFSLYCQTDMISVGINDLANISLYLTEWK
jgi:hypothetical protein